MIELSEVHKSFGANHVLRGITGQSILVDAGLAQTSAVI